MNHTRLKITLDRLYDSYLREYRRSPATFFQTRRDPILFPHRYTEFHDIEAAAFLASTFAYGNVPALCAFVERLLSLLQPTPYQFLCEGPGAVDSLRAAGLYYRLQKSDEILALLKALSRVYCSGESLYSVFMSKYDNNHTMKIILSQFTDRFRSFSPTPLKFLIPSPADGSTCKRLNLFLRWMIRRDGFDFGIWREAAPSKLVIPADTHIGRVAYRLGWIQTPSLAWNKAEAITAVLRKFDPDDPIRYDFSLCHESIARSEWLSGMLRDEG